MPSSSFPMTCFSLGFPKELLIWKLQELPQNFLPGYCTTPAPPRKPEGWDSPFSFPVRLQTTTFVSHRSLVETPICCSHSGRNLSAQKLSVVHAWSSPMSTGDSNQASKRMRRFEFSATQYEAISYGPLLDSHSKGFCTFRSMQIPRLTELSGGGKRNVVNPVPIGPRDQRRVVT
jgi:hypothetical protein